MARSPGEGTIHKNEARGRYEGRLTIAYDPETGKRTRQKFTGRTRGEVVAKMDAARKALGEGLSTKQEKRTVGQWMTYWLDEVIPGTVAPATEANYRNLVRLYIRPAIGGKKLVALQPADVAKMMRAMAAEGKSPNTQRLARAVLRRALRRAEQEGVVTRNVAAIADGVKVGAPKGRTLTVPQAKQLLAAVKGDRLEAAYVLALTLGLRRGELLGLAWPDVDLDADAPTITITRSLKRLPGRGLVVDDTKTAGSRRRVHLPAPTVQVLKDHRARMAAEKKAVGKSWPDRPLGVDLVFRSPIGTAVDPDNFRNATYRLTESTFRPYCDRKHKDGKHCRYCPKPTKEDRWSPHELRHSAASLLIAQDVPLKVVSEVLGHSSIRITGDIYAHLFDDAGKVAADAMTDALYSDDS